MTADQYPYTSGSTVLTAVIQNNALNEQGAQGGIGRVAPTDILLASAPRHPEYEGKTLQDLCEQFGLPAEAAAQRVLDEEGRGVVVVLEMMDEADVSTVMRHATTLVVFDPATIMDTGTYADPRQYPAGMRHVFVNGVPVMRDGRHTGARPGRALRRA